MSTTQPDETPVSRATLSLPWKGWTRTATSEAIELVCDTAPIVVTLAPLRDGTWFASYQIDGAAAVLLSNNSRRLDRMECRVVWALGEAIGLERDRLARKQDAIAAMAVEADRG